MAANILQPPDLASDPTVRALKPALGKKALSIKTVEDYECATVVLKQANANLEVIEAARVKITGPLNQALKAANAQARHAAAPFVREVDIIKDAIIEYKDRLEAEREAEQRRANKAAREEQERLQAIADAAEEKAQAQARKLREEAERLQAAGDAKAAERLSERADAAEQSGQAKADEFNDRASQVVAVVSQRAEPRVAGVALSKVWDFEVIDEAQIPREYTLIDHVKIRKIVVALKGLCKIPGIRVFQVRRVSAGKA